MERLADRRAVRALIFAPCGRTLLFHYRNDPGIYSGAAPHAFDSYWGTVGGGIEGDEDDLPALAREMREETGCTNFTVGPRIGVRDVDLFWHGKRRRIIETYYAVTVPSIFDMNESLRTEFEKGFILGAQWWRADDFAAAGVPVFPSWFLKETRNYLSGRTMHWPFTMTGD